MPEEVDELEFRICQYLDGTLSEAERAAMETLLASDESARALLEEHRRLNTAFLAIPRVPNVLWDQLSEQVGSAFRATDDLEFAISQHVDGTLGEAERQAVETRIAEDADARSIHTEHARLTSALRALPTAQNVDWQAFGGRIAAAVDRQSAQSERGFRLFAWRGPFSLAMAASLLIAVGVAISIYVRHAASTRPTPIGPVALAPVIDVSGPSAEVGTEPIADVRIGPARSLGADSLASGYDDDVVFRPARVIMASSAAPRVEPIGMPY